MAKGDGSIIARSRGLWEVQLSLGKDPATGKYRKVSRMVKGTKADARKVRDELRQEYDGGLTADAAKTTVGAFMSEWIKNRRESGELAHATISNYERYVRVWIAPYLGNVAVKDLKPFTVEAWHREARKAGATPRTLQAAHKVLKMALKDAVRYGLTLTNPCESVKTPKAEERKRGYLVPDEVRRMLTVLDSMEETGFTMAVRLGLATGARRGEVLGLQWRDVDFAVRSVSIARSLAQVDGAKKNGLPAKQLKSTKTESGKRKVAIDDGTASCLAEWKEHQRKELEGMGIRQQPDTPVCCSLNGSEFDGAKAFAGKTLDPQAFSTAFRKFCEAHGFCSTTGRTLCFHELRHTQATLLLSHGEDVVSVSGRLGHASPSITTDMYAHAMPERDRDCASVMGDVFAPQVKQGRIIKLKTA